MPLCQCGHIEYTSALALIVVFIDISGGLYKQFVGTGHSYWKDQDQYTAMEHRLTFAEGCPYPTATSNQRREEVLMMEERAQRRQRMANERHWASDWDRRWLWTGASYRKKKKNANSPLAPNDWFWFCGLVWLGWVGLVWVGFGLVFSGKQANYWTKTPLRTLPSCAG